LAVENAVVKRVLAGRDADAVRDEFAPGCQMHLDIVGDRGGRRDGPYVGCRGVDKYLEDLACGWEDVQISACTRTRLHARA
jgi:hypothetical protein